MGSGVVHLTLMDRRPQDDIGLRIGYWFAVHGAQLRTWWGVSILVIDVLLVGYFLYAFTSYSFSTQAIVRSVAATAEPLVGSQLRSMVEPKTLELGSAVALPRGKSTFDFAVPVTNPNEAYAATDVRYRFQLGTATTREERATLWPGQVASLMLLSVVVPNAPADAKASVEILGVTWQRPIDRKIYTSEVRFPVTDAFLVPLTGLPSGAVGTRMTARVRNDSVRSFREVRFGVVVSSGSRVVAVNEVTVERFVSLHERTIETSWLQAIPPGSSVVVFPQVNLLDSSIYR